MDSTPPTDAESVPPTSAFEKAGKERGGGLLSDFWHFLKQNKKWWLLPIVLMLLFLGALLLFSGTAVAPFIYTFW